MLRIGTWRVLNTTILWAVASVCALAQTELRSTHQIRLPVSSSRGSYDHFPYPGMNLREHFSMRVVPDQSLLVLDSDASGNWPLIRLRKWWTDAPATEVLSVPGWSSIDANHLNSINLDVQIMPDGRYAVAFAGAYWMEKSAFLLHAPSGYVVRKPDTIITVIDLEKWKIVSSIHTIGIADGPVSGVRVVNDKWMVLDFTLGQSPVGRLLYRYDSRLVSLPNLHSGPECLSDRPFRGYRDLSLETGAAMAERHNEAVCQGLLQATETSSVDALETLIDRGQDVLPAAVRQSSRDLQDTEDDFFRGWGDFPYYLFYYENPPFESSSHRWYGLYGSREHPTYNLTIFDAEGNRQKSETANHLLCGDPSLDQKGSACACRVVDVVEQQHEILALCRTQRGDYSSTVSREWLSVLRSDDLSGAGLISLSSKYHHETLQYFAQGDGRGYVVALESGETLQIYQFPTAARPPCRGATGTTSLRIGFSRSLSARPQNAQTEHSD